MQAKTFIIVVVLFLLMCSALSGQGNVPTIDQPQDGDGHLTASRGQLMATRNDTLRGYMAPRNLGALPLLPGTDFLPDSLRGNYFQATNNNWYFVAYDRSFIDVTAGSGSGGVQSVQAGTNVNVDATDPDNPIINVPTLDDADADPTNELDSKWVESGGNIRRETGSISIGGDQSNLLFHVINGKTTFGGQWFADWRGEVTIVSRSSFLPSPNVDKTLLLHNPQATGTDGETLGSLFFAPHNLARAHAGISAFQDGTDTDHIGLQFWTHPGNGSSDDAYYAGYFDRNGRLHLNRLLTDTYSSIYTGLIGINPDGQLIGVDLADIPGLSGHFSPWQQNGSNIYFNTGFVGIGTTTPSVDLHIANLTGNVEGLFEGDDFATFRIVADNAGLGVSDPSMRFVVPAQEWRFGIDNSNLDMLMISPGALNSSTATMMLRPDVKRVGIGVSPQRELHVGGMLRVDDISTGSPIGLVGFEADGDLVDGTDLADVTGNNDYYVQESHSGSNQGIDKVFNPEGAEYVNENFTGQVRFQLPESFTNARYEMKVQVMTRRNEARTGTGTLVFSWQEKSGGGLDRSLAWVEATGMTNLDTLKWGADDLNNVTSIFIGEPNTYWDEEWSFKVTEFNMIEVPSGDVDNYATGWSTSLITTGTVNGIGFSPVKGLQGKSRFGKLDMQVIEYPSDATWAIGDDSRDLNDQYIRVKIPLENRRISGAFYHFQMKVHNDKEPGAAQVRTIDVMGDYDQGNFGVLEYTISGDGGSDMPLNVYAPNRDSSVYLFFGDGTEDYEHEKIVVTRWEWSIQRFYDNDWADYNNGWEVGLIAAIDRPITDGPYTPDRQRLETSGTELTYNGNTVDLATAIAAGATPDGNGIVGSTGPHTIEQGTTLRWVDRPGGSLGRGAMAFAEVAGNDSYHYWHAYGNNSKGARITARISNSSGNVVSSSVQLSDPTNTSTINGNGKWYYDNGVDFYGIDWAIPAFRVSGTEFVDLPNSMPPNDGMYWGNDSDGSGGWQTGATILSESRDGTTLSTSSTSFVTDSQLQITGIPPGIYEYTAKVRISELGGNSYDCRVNATNYFTNNSREHSPGGTSAALNTIYTSSASDYATEGVVHFSSTGTFYFEFAAQSGSHTVQILPASYVKLTKIN